MQPTPIDWDKGTVWFGLKIFSMKQVLGLVMDGLLDFRSQLYAVRTEYFVKSNQVLLTKVMLLAMWSSSLTGSQFHCSIILPMTSVLVFNYKKNINHFWNT